MKIGAILEFVRPKTVFAGSLSNFVCIFLMVNGLLLNMENHFIGHINLKGKKIKERELFSSRFNDAIKNNLCEILFLYTSFFVFVFNFMTFNKRAKRFAPIMPSPFVFIEYFNTSLI